MKRSITISILTLIAMVISACGGTPAEPTISAEDIQSTAVAAAFTIVAETQAAIPTNTPIPPTDTPVPTAIPTDTPFPSPTLETLLIPTFTALPTTTSDSGNNTGADPCNQALPGDVAGTPTKIKLVNNTKAPIIVSLYLNLTPFGECGFRGYNIEKNDALTITDLVQGCYFVSVIVNDPKKPSKAFGSGCINNPDLWTFEINAESVKFVGP